MIQIATKRGVQVVPDPQRWSGGTQFEHGPSLVVGTRFTTRSYWEVDIAMHPLRSTTAPFDARTRSFAPPHAPFDEVPTTPRCVAHALS